MIVTAHPARVDGLEIQEVDDGFVVHHRAAGRRHRLNHTAVLVLELCDGRRSAEDIAEQVRAAFGLAAPPRRDVEEILARMADHGLVIDPSETRPPRAAYRNATRNDQWLVEHVFPGKRGGYFVEAGAADGVGGSACYVLEKELGWTGICIEPNDAFFAGLVVNRPGSAHENVCLAGAAGRVAYIEGDEGTVSPYLGGIKSNLLEHKWGGREVVDRGREVAKRAETLAALLDAHGAPPVIDYGGFDIEGSELEVLSGFPFDRYTFLAMTVECDDAVWDRLLPILEAHGYVEVDNAFNADMFWERYLLHESIRPTDGDGKAAAAAGTAPPASFPIAGYFCINLPHRADRRRAFEAQMARTRSRWIAPIEENIRPGVLVRSLAEVDPGMLPLAPYLKEFPEGIRLGAIGCYRAHTAVLEEIAARDTDRWYVVFEDDVHIRSADWLAVLGGLRLPRGCDDTDVVFVDLLGQRLAEDEIEPGWFRISRTFPNYHGAHCYVLLGSGAARRVLQAVLDWPYLEDIDGLMMKAGRSLAWYPGVAATRPSRSDRFR